MKKLIFIAILLLSSRVISSQNVNYIPFYTDASFNSKTIDVTKPVGSTTGKSSVSDGCSNYTIPILSPPRPEGGIPPAEITIQYNSLSKDGALGRGWNITGLSVINRVQKTIAHNGVVAPVCTGADEYMWDGNKLFKETGGTNTIEYWKTELETFAEIQSSRDNSGRITEWVITTKDGNKYFYGGVDGWYASNSTCQNTECNVANGGYMIYYLDYIQFPNGTTRQYSYIFNGQKERLISQIYDDYGSIEFLYKDRIDKNTTYLGGSKIDKDVLLDNILIKNYNGDLIKKYLFKYSCDFVNSVLSEVEEEGSDATKLNSTIFQYSTKVFDHELATTYTISNRSGMPTHEVQSGDFDGNGVSDLLVIDKDVDKNCGGANPCWYTWFSVGFRIFTKDPNSNTFTNSYTSPLLTDAQVGNPTPKDNIQTFMSSDFNGDGRDDILINSIDRSNPSSLKLLSSTIFYSNETATNFTQSTNNPPTGNVSGTSTPINLISTLQKPYFHIGDFDGDGNKDIFYVLGGGSKLYISFPSRNIYFREVIGVDKPQVCDQGYLFPSSMVSSAETITSIDMDGDGKSELFTANNCTSGCNSSIVIILAFEENAAKTTSYLKYKIYETNAERRHNYRFGDFNGDGKTDVLFKTTEGISKNWKIGHSTGNIFNYYNFTFNNDVDVNNFSLNYISDILLVADFNGDGKSDIAHGKFYYTSSSNKPLQIYYSGTQTYSQSSGSYSTLTRDGLQTLGDFNGDGKIDIINWDGTGAGGGAGGFTSRNYSVLQFNASDYLLRKVKNGFGSMTEFNYNTLSKLPITRNYNGIDNYNGNLYYKFPINVVTTYKNEIGNVDYAYTYFGATFNKKGRGFLGFRQVDQLDNVRNEQTSIYLNKFSSFTNYPDIVFNDYVEKKLNGAFLEDRRLYFSAGINDGIRLWLKNDKIETSSYLNGNTTTNYIYDTYGNITSKEEINADNNSALTTLVFGTNASNRPALPTASTITYSRAGKPSISYTTNYEYTSMFQLSKKIEFAGLPKTKTTEYLYNYLGNLLEEKITGTGMTPRKIEIFYDPNNDKFVQKKKNSLGQETNYIMDEKWNVPLSVTEINGLTINYNYDGFGRKVAETLPTGKILNTAFLWNNSVSFIGNHNSVYKVKSSSANSPIEEVYYDKNCRVIAEKSQQFNGSYNISNKHYNSQNQNYLTKNYSQSGQLIGGIQNTYDIYGRQLSSNYFDQNNTSHNISNTSYNKGSNFWEITESTPASSSNSSGMSNYTKVSLAGEVLESKENGSNSITFEYNAQGKKTKVLNGSTTLVENEYDVYGQQSKMIDNSAGTQTYIYNALGEITQQTNPNNGFIKFEYDVLGRKTKEIVNEGTITYSYFPTGSGVKTNLIKEAKGYNNQNKEEFNYDNFGRVISIKRTIPNSPVGATGYTSQISYNADGQVIQKITPSGKTYDYTYNSFGFLKDIKKGTQIIYSLSSTSITGKPSSYNLGTTTISIGYNSFNRPNSIGSNYILDEYIWDDINGNLVEKQELNKIAATPKAFVYNYVYDNFDRLTEENLDIVGRPTIPNPLNYQGNGRINEKYSVSGVPYVYHTNKKYAVANIFDAYDFSPYQQNISYSSFNKPTKLTQNGYTLYYAYNHQYERNSAILERNGSVLNRRFYAGTTDFNYDARNALINSVDYIYAGDQLVAMEVTTPSRADIWYLQQDYQNSIRTVFNDAGQFYYQNFDAWGNYRDNNNTSSTLGEISYERPVSLPDWLYRGYTEQEHLPEFRLINLNARLYDPHVARMLSPDNFITTNSLMGYNRYSYAHNNPTKFSDPDGNLPVIPIIAGAVIGAWMGGTMANNGNMNPISWDYNSGKTWGYMAGGAFSGAISGGVAGAIASSGIPMANTISIMAGSITNSILTHAYTNGQTDISMSFGIASINFTNGEFGYFLKSGNSTLENIGFGLGGLANLQDVFAGLNGGNVDVNSASTKKPHEWWGHSSITDENGGNIVSSGPLSGASKSSGFFKNMGHKLWPTYAGEKGTWTQKLYNVNVDKLAKYGSNIKKWSILGNSCVSHTSRALWLSGIPTLPINFHPHILNFQLLIREGLIYNSYQFNR